MRTTRFHHVVASGLLVALLAAASQAENRLEAWTTARSGGTAITEIVADGDNDLQVQNHATRGGMSRLAVDAAARDGGTIRGQIFAGSRGGVHDGGLLLRANGPGAVIDLQDVSVTDGGTIYHYKRLAADGDSQLRWRSQQFAGPGQTATAQQDIELQAAPGSQNRLDVDLLTDAIGHDAASQLRMRLQSRAGGRNEHRLTGASVAYDGPAAIVGDFHYRADGGVNRSQVGLFESR